jgi:hypothetical protein
VSRVTGHRLEVLAAAERGEIRWSPTARRDHGGGGWLWDGRAVTGTVVSLWRQGDLDWDVVPSSGARLAWVTQQGLMALRAAAKKVKAVAR